MEIRDCEFFDTLPFAETHPAGYWRGEIDGRKVAYCEYGAHNGGGSVALADDGLYNQETILVAVRPWDTFLRVPRADAGPQISLMVRAADAFKPLAIVGADEQVGPWTVYAGAIEIAPPAWAPDTMVWRGRGGVVVGFLADPRPGQGFGSAPRGYSGTRHVRHAKEWFTWPHSAATEWAQQGDVFWAPGYFGATEDIVCAEIKEGAALDRHVVVRREDGALVLEHPEHESVTIIPPGDEPMGYLVMLPGRSRRQRGIGD